MDYLSIYNSIIANAKSADRRRRKHTDKKYIYYEKHHVIPKCVGGSDDVQNLVLLTAREHFVAHQLLVKIYTSEYKLVFALRRMCSNNNTNHKRNNKEYEWIRKRIAIESSLMQKGKLGKGYKFPKGHHLSDGEKNGMYGKNHTLETRILQSQKSLLRDPISYEFARLPKSDLHKENISKSKRHRMYKLISPEGKEYIFDRCIDASNFSGVSTAALIKLAGNRYTFNHCKNWKCSTEPL